MDDFSERDLKLIGMLEVLGAMGLILTQLTGILPWLVTISSFGLVLTMFSCYDSSFTKRRWSKSVDD